MQPLMDTKARGSRPGTSLGIRMALLAPCSLPGKESSVSPKKGEEKAAPESTVEAAARSTGRLGQL